MAFSKESLRLNGQGLLFGLGVGLLVGVLGGLFDRLLAWADVLRNGTAWASLLLPLARGWWWCGCTAGAHQNRRGDQT